MVRNLSTVCNSVFKLSNFLGISTPTLSVSGRPLPGSRAVSLVIFPDVPVEDPKWTLAAMQYGQIITHDMSLAAGTTQARKSCSF